MTSREQIAIGCLGAVVVVLAITVGALLGLRQIFGQALPPERAVHPSPDGTVTVVLETHAGGGAAGWVYSEMFLQTADGARVRVPRNTSDDVVFRRWNGPAAFSVCMRSPVTSQRMRLVDGQDLEMINECPTATADQP